jgi:hypothetical protein
MMELTDDQLNRMINRSTDELDIEKVREALVLLGDRFESVQICATRQEGNDTFYTCKGSGNYFARYGVVKMWLDSEEKGNNMNGVDEEND